MTPALPLRDYAEARLHYEEKAYEDAWSFFEHAIARLGDASVPQIADLRFYAAETLLRLGRHDEAERQLLDELLHFPQNTRARAALAALYHSMDRTVDAGQVLTELVLLDPTPEAYRLAARLWTTVGNPQQAATVRAEAARLFAVQTPSSASTIN
jgi:tetratricopeptide (TPR) repeat protein